ncbi:hypothetical protein GCM10009776_35120 [Microbacterium deminutum]|uniref:HTH IS21-type domain-containing protein n=1 Tax=Microbacterium deminutum TaxID=344164 RepID=A0ABN2RH91_9MICO
MLSEEADVDIHALRRQGMTISEIARRTDNDRRTIRGYLNGDRVPGRRERAAPDAFDGTLFGRGAPPRPGDGRGRKPPHPWRPGHPVAWFHVAP